MLGTFDDSTNTVKGAISLFKTPDPTKWLEFNITALATPSGYRNIASRTLRKLVGATRSRTATHSR